MWHDYCVNRNDKLNLKNTGCSILKSSFFENVPCGCDFDIIELLSEKKLINGCANDEDCIFSGRTIRSAFYLHPCSCKVEKCWKIPFLRFNDKNEMKVNWKSSCINQNACLPSSICKMVQSIPNSMY